jgi:hypothetical protein
LGWERDRILSDLREVKARVGWAGAGDEARRWWTAFERAYADAPVVVLRVAEEVEMLGSTIPEFFLAFRAGNTDDVVALLHYLAYGRATKRWERKDGTSAAAEGGAASRTPPPPQTGL